MSINRSGVIGGAIVLLVATVGGFWFGHSFKLGVAILVVSAFIVARLLLRYRKDKFVRDLQNVDRETQDAALAELDADDRREILRRLGRDAA